MCDGPRVVLWGCGSAARRASPSNWSRGRALPFGCRGVWRVGCARFVVVAGACWMAFAGLLKPILSHRAPVFARVDRVSREHLRPFRHPARFQPCPSSWSDVRSCGRHRWADMGRGRRSGGGAIRRSSEVAPSCGVACDVFPASTLSCEALLSAKAFERCTPLCVVVVQLSAISNHRRRPGTCTANHFWGAPRRRR